ncbi:MAG: hypothetical protein ABGY96_21985 [bacterium]|nr:hypothetical protein [Gammaproteobacteria bacterium]HIL98990.1 hypothetical protein [Pseudomonadales bacterium]
MIARPGGRIFRIAAIQIALLLLLAGCSGGSDTTPAPVLVDTLDPYVMSAGSRAAIQPVVTSTSSSILLNCLVLLRETQGCDFNTLPLLGMETSNPSIDDIMARVLVSHDWMGTRFREVLERMPPEMLLMARGLTGIVISYDIRPSHYQPYSGAIYLDPEGLWLTAAEAAVIDPTPDFRSDFSSELQFTFLRRYVESNIDLRSQPRSIDAISFRTAALLYHELAHANDFFAPDRIDVVVRTVPVHVAIAGTFPSSRLRATYPLLSQIMFGLAGVSFQGDTATEFQRGLTAQDVAAEFPTDFSNDYYNYTTQYEDLAMVFEEALMFYSFGVQRDVAVTQVGETECSQYVVEWGQRNRIADPAIKARAMFAITAVLPELSDQIALGLESVEPQIQMQVGVDWCTNILLSPSNQTSLVIDTGIEPASVELVIPYQ